MAKIIKVEMTNVKTGEPVLTPAIKITGYELLPIGGYGQCDFCGKDCLDKDMYILPALGSNALCTECFNDTKRNFYPEEEDIYLEFFRTATKAYGLVFDEKDKLITKLYLDGNQNWKDLIS